MTDRRHRVVSRLLLAAVVSILAGTALAAPPFAEAAGVGAAPRPFVGQPATPPAPVAAAASTGSDLLTPSAARLPDEGPVNGVAFQMSVPAIGYRATVREGVDAAILDLGPGHYTTSGWPGRPGNVGVAAHNTYWLGFGSLKVHDRVELTTPHALYVYEITGIEVVSPDDRTVLAPTADDRLTMTTCWPLWAGAWATQRLVFKATEIGAVAAAAAAP
jgi:LPXTG-site transpeptidase (sortase) family protein